MYVCMYVRVCTCVWCVTLCDCVFVLQTFYEAAEIGAEEPAPDASQLLVAVTSDRGLCGAVHSSIAKRIRANYTPAGNYKIVCIGDKSRTILQRYVSGAVVGQGWKGLPLAAGSERRGRAG